MDEDPARATVGDVRPLDERVTLVDYDPEWPERYAALARRIRKALGDVVVLLEHVGSTSVPGLIAKPIIDIVLAVADSANEGAYVAALEAEGYALHHREPDWYEHRMLKGGDADVNLHVFSAGCPEIDRMLVFRDRLRAEPAERVRYAALKRRLAARRWSRVQDYADAKTVMVEGILSRAQERKAGHVGQAPVLEQAASPDAGGKGCRRAHPAGPRRVSRDPPTTLRFRSCVRGR